MKQHEMPQEQAPPMPAGVPDVISPNLDVLFVGINPSIRTVEVQHHFAGPQNRFYKALYGAGFTPRLWTPAEDRELLKLGLGLTNFVERPTNRGNDVAVAELELGLIRLLKKVDTFQPRFVAVLEMTRIPPLLGDRRGVRPGEIAPPRGSPEGTRWWILPNPSARVSYYVHSIGSGYRGLHDAVQHG